MSWRQKLDLGTSVVASVHDVLRIPDEWLIDRGERGFTWWAGDYAQSIWADLGNFHNGVTVYRLHCETELLRGAGKSDEIELKLARFLRDCTLSALVYDPAMDLYKLHCGVYAHEENVDWLKRIFMAASALQVIDAQANEARDPESCLDHAITIHPTHGRRGDVDPILQFASKFFIPVGQQPNKWLGVEEWQEARARVRRIAQHAVSDNASYIEAEFDFRPEMPPIRLDVRADRPHPILGTGLDMRLTLPVSLPTGRRIRMALELNERERNEWNWCHDVGSWCCIGSEVLFYCFVPNITYSAGTLSELAHDMAMRGSWVSEELERNPIAFEVSA